VAGLSLTDRVRSSAIRRGLGEEPQLLCIERSQLRWYGHLMKIFPGSLPLEVFWARSVGGRPRTCWRNLHYEIPLEELESHCEIEMDVRLSLLDLLPL